MLHRLVNEERVGMWLRCTKQIRDHLWVRAVYLPEYIRSPSYFSDFHIIIFLCSILSTITCLLYLLFSFWHLYLSKVVGSDCPINLSFLYRFEILLNLFSPWICMKYCSLDVKQQQSINRSYVKLNHLLDFLLRQNKHAYCSGQSSEYSSHSSFYFHFLVRSSVKQCGVCHLGV